MKHKYVHRNGTPLYPSALLRPGPTQKNNTGGPRGAFHFLIGTSGLFYGKLQFSFCISRLRLAF